MTKMNTSREVKGLPLSPDGNCSEVNRLFSELVLLSWLAQQKHERRRLVMASLESLLEAGPTQPQNLTSNRDFSLPEPESVPDPSGFVVGSWQKHPCCHKRWCANDSN
jgi:hypothetical protein